MVNAYEQRISVSKDLIDKISIPTTQMVKMPLSKGSNDGAPPRREESRGIRNG